MFKLKLALKYFYRRPVSWIATLAVAVCVFIVLVVMTVMHGLVIDYAEKNHRMVGDCVISSDSLVGFPHYEDFIKKLKQQDFVLGASPVVHSFALVSLDGGSGTAPVELVGIEAESIRNTTNFMNTLYVPEVGKDNVFSTSLDKNYSGCIRGIAMMNSRNSDGKYVHAIDRSKKFVITCFPLSYKGTLMKAGTDIVNTKAFYLVNDAETGIASTDSRTIYVSFEDAQLLCGMAGNDPRCSAIYIKFNHDADLLESTELVRGMWNDYISQFDGKFASLLKEVKVETWKVYRRESIAPMEKEQTMLIALFIMIGCVTVFIVFVVFFMIVNSKRKDIGIFRSFGISPIQLCKLFLVFSMLIGVLGFVIGAFSGWAFLVKINRLEDWLFETCGWQLWDRTMYNIGDIPSDITPEVIWVLFIASVVACQIGAFVPVWQASHLKPVETLQVDE